MDLGSPFCYWTIRRYTNYHTILLFTKIILPLQRNKKSLNSATKNLQTALNTHHSLFIEDGVLVVPIGCLQP